MARGAVATSDGEDASALIADMGLSLFPWQRSVLADWCARDAADRPSYTTVGLSVPRQNGKNAVLEAYEFYQLVVCGSHVLHTAHRVKTAKKSFQRLVRYFSDRRHPEVCRMVSNVRYTNGEEAIFLTNGASVEFSARSRAGTRGFDDIQTVVFDEAQDLTDDQLNAIMYTLAASSTGDRQMILTGTPPDPSSPGTVFRRSRAAALEGRARRALWHEWGVESMPPPASTFDGVLDLVYQTNPSMGYILDEEFTQTEFANSSIDGFARERLGWWSEEARAEALVSERQWGECETPATPDLSPEGFERSSGRLAYGVKFSADGSRVCVAVAVRPEEGPVHCELVADRPMEMGVGWLADWLVDRRQICSVAVIDGKGAAPALCERIGARMPRRALLVPNAGMVKDAAAMTVDAIRDKGMVHVADERLARSVTSCVRRPIGTDGGFGFGGDDPTPTEALSLALWGAKTTKRRAGRGCVAL